MEYLELKEQLKQIRDNDFDILENMDLHEMTQQLLDNIGHLDPEFRDDLVLNVICYWFYVKRYYTPEELRKILYTILDENHLFYKIGNKGDDTVYTRSFSVLVAAIMIRHHNENEPLAEEDFNYLKNKLLEYYAGEKDWRGYVPVQGWAHSVAHGADAMRNLAKCPEVDREDILKILDLIKVKVWESEHVYDAEEDERMVNVMMNIIDRKILSTDELLAWITSLKVERTGDYAEYHKMFINAKHFLRSLYFRLLKDDQYLDLSEPIKDLLYVMSNR